MADSNDDAVCVPESSSACLNSSYRYIFMPNHHASHSISYNMPETALLRKDQLELSLHKEKKLIEDGILKEDNPLDITDNFRKLCEGCRRGDLKACQEMIMEGVNINARDSFDYTPLILVSLSVNLLLLSREPWEEVRMWRGKLVTWLPGEPLWTV